MKVIALTQKGISKQENEDCVVIGRNVVTGGTLFSEIDEGVLAVADGVGGNIAGAVASRFVADRICHLKEVNENTLHRINNELLELSSKQSEYKGMATTLAGVLLSNQKVILFSIGNTRVYLLQSRKYLKQLTIDDTTVNYLISTGQMTLEEAVDFDRKNEITACFGGGQAGLFKITIENIDTISSPVIITSDGIHDYLTVDKMEDIIQEFGLSEKTCEEMMASARNAGSNDDISILIGGI